MEEFSNLCLDTFLERQGQLFDERVAETREEAREFLEEMFAQVVKTPREVRAYLDEIGMDVSGVPTEELLDAAEVFPLPDGTFLIVEG